MIFVFDDDFVFLIEKEPFFIKMQHVRACDFICLKKRKKAETLLFIEAKNTAPVEKESLENYLQKINDKFCHSLFLYISILFERHNASPDRIPDAMRHKVNLKRKIRCILVVRQHKKAWVAILHEALRKKMKSLQNSFALQDVTVMNENDAIKYGLASPSRALPAAGDRIDS